MIQNLDTVEKIIEYFSDWAIKPEAERLNFIRALRTKGTVSAVTPSKPGQENCPVHNFQIARPCGLGKCSYNIAFPQHKNCLFVAMSESKNGRLNPDEIAGLLGVTLKEVNNQHANAVKKIQQSLIKEAIQFERLPTFSYLEGHCINCETYIQDEMDMGLSPDLYYKANTQLAWCSVKCKRAKPENEFRIEFDFGAAFKSVLKLAASMASMRLPAKNSTYLKIDQVLDLDMGTTERTINS